MISVERLRAQPTSLRVANEYVERFHRHHKGVPNHRFSISAWRGTNLVGVAIVRKPAARNTDGECVCEVARLCSDGSKNVCSFLYARAARAADAMGFSRIQTFILDCEPGLSLHASGWELDGTTPGGGWSRASRGRADAHPICPKHRYVKDFKDNIFLLANA